MKLSYKMSSIFNLKPVTRRTPFSLLYSSSLTFLSVMFCRIDVGPRAANGCIPAFCMTPLLRLVSSPFYSEASRRQTMLTQPGRQTLLFFFSLALLTEWCKKQTSWGESSPMHFLHHAMLNRQRGLPDYRTKKCTYIYILY